MPKASLDVLSLYRIETPNQRPFPPRALDPLPANRRRNLYSASIAIGGPPRMRLQPPARGRGIPLLIGLSIDWVIDRPSPIAGAEGRTGVEEAETAETAETAGTVETAESGAPAPYPSRTVIQPRSAEAGWRAQLELGFERRDGRTRLHRRWHRGPLRVQKPFYPRCSGAGDDFCQVVILHPPGGVVGGDRLAIDVRVGAGCRALITTPGATKFYRTAGPEAVQRVHLRVAPEAILEWTPQETILFDGSRSRIETRVQLEAGGRFLGWEITALGRPAARAPFSNGLCRQAFEIEREGKPLWVDRSEYRGGGESLEGRWGLAGRAAVGTLVSTGGTESVLAAAREALAAFAGDDRLAGATRRGELLILRALAPETRQIFDLFAGLRETLLGEPTPAARIWAT